MELEEFFDGRRTIKVKANKKGATLTITYDPSVVTRRELQAMSDVEYLATTIKAWDLTRGGQPVPLTVEGLDALPREFVRTVLGWVRSDAEEIPKEKWTLSQTGSASGQQGDGNDG